MKVLLLSQVFYPDVVAVAQHLGDLGVGLSDAGHEVTVLCSGRAYDSPTLTFPKREIWKGISIRRIPVLGLGKKSKLRRIIGAGSFFASSFAALASMRRQDVVVVVPPPPLLSVLAALFVQWRGGRLVYWNMDLNPDEAIAAGWMNADSFSARLLGNALRYSLRVSSAIVVLDRFTKDRIVSKGIPEDKVHIVPVWALDEAAHYDSQGRDQFRKAHNLEDKLVVMYSGNHSPLHPLDTILDAALRLQGHQEIVFLFVGGGSEFSRVKNLASEHNLSNVICLPYLPLAGLAASLSAGDLHVVLLGDPFVGIVHPCKIYNILAVGAPFLYVGPVSSHIVDLQEFPEIRQMGKFVRHGEVDGVVRLIIELAAATAQGTSVRPGRPAALDRFSREALMPRMLNIIEKSAGPGAAGQS